MPDAWDTTVASRADARHAGLLRKHVLSEQRIALPAPTVQEIARGLQLRVERDLSVAARLEWFRALIVHPLVKVLPFGASSGMLAGRLLAVLPQPPTGGHRRHGTRAQQRAAWALDVQIAACAFAGGYGILTENVHDFAVLRNAIAELVPGVPPLVVNDARELAEAPA